MITKENLIKFISDNYDELVKGGCADWSLLEENDMTVKEYDDCEKAITKLLAGKHTGKANGFKSLWAVKPAGSDKEVFGDPWKDDGRAFRNRSQAEAFAKKECGKVIEYVVDSFAFKEIEAIEAWQIEEFVNKNGYTVKRCVKEYNEWDD